METQPQLQQSQPETSNLLHSERKPEDILLQDQCVRRARLALVRGKDFSKSRFPMYTGLVSQMRVAYDRRTPDRLVSTLASYLKLAGALVPGTPDPVDREEICARIGALIEEYGIVAMSRVLLPGLW